MHDHTYIYMHITHFSAWVWSVFDWLFFSIYFSISCRHHVFSSLSVHRFRGCGHLCPGLHKVPLLRQTSKSCPFFPVLLCSPTLLGLPTHALPVISCMQKEQERFLCCCPEQYILLFTVEIGLHFFGSLQMLVESRAGDEAALLPDNYPCARQAHGFTSTVNSSGGKGSHSCIILGSTVPHTLPSAVRTAAMHGDKVPFGQRGFMHSETRRELAYAMKMKNWGLI